MNEIDSLKKQIADLTAQCGGAIAEAAAAKRERDLARAGLDTKAVAYIRDAAKSEEREACALIVQRIGGTLCFDAATAIRARGGQ